MQEQDWKNAFLETFVHKIFSFFHGIPYILIYLLIGNALSCTTQGEKPSVGNYINQGQLHNENHEINFVIYNLLIKDVFGSNNKGLLLIDNQTEAFSKIGGGIDDTLNYVQKKTEEKSVNESVFQNFKEKNKVSENLIYLSECGEKCLLINHQEITKLFTKSNGWEELHKRYPTFRSLLTFSQIGFDGHKTKALVYMGYVNGMKAGEGFYFLLVKEEESWKIKEKINVWDS
ncbi:MAG: hypothetical protein M3367_10550 [Acidobacteriota bacterium]|nr:hypothetical protein [Acidobacteriota bacterium]